MKALTEATQRKNYYVEYYNGEPTYKNRVFFLCHYGRDYESEKAAKIAAFNDFRLGRFTECTTIALLECNGMQIADKSEPYGSKPAITKHLIVKRF